MQISVQYEVVSGTLASSLGTLLDPETKYMSTYVLLFIY